jgi:predicted ATPase
MLETIREFALEQLLASGEDHETRLRHAEFLRDLAERAEPALGLPAERDTWTPQLEHLHDNFRAALDWSLSDEGVLDHGIALAGALGYFWFLSGRLEEAHSWYEALLARPRRRPSGLGQGAAGGGSRVVGAW